MSVTEGVSAPDINKVGFFHCCNNDATSAIKTLSEYLEDARIHLSDCLIVLPEAFNLWPYNKDNKSPDPSVRNCLKKLSEIFKVAFVAGLIENREGEKLGHNSAYLIDGDLCKVLSCKTGCDGVGAYKSCVSEDTPFPHRGICIAALICMDASSNSCNRGSTNEQQKAMTQFNQRRNRIKEGTKNHRVAFCIPSRMEQTDTTGLAKEWSEQLPNAVVVLANAPSVANEKFRSVIYPKGEPIFSRCSGGNEMQIISWPISP